MNKALTVLALYLASAAMSALAGVYELPADGAALVGTDSRITLGDGEKLFDVARGAVSGIRKSCARIPALISGWLAEPKKSCFPCAASRRRRLTKVS
jgi:hypothetical protein